MVIQAGVLPNPEISTSVEDTQNKATRTTTIQVSQRIELGGKRYCHLLDPQSGEPVTHTQALTVLVSSRPAAGTLSDAASKPLFIAGPEWPAAARKMGVDQVLRIDSGGRVQVSGKLKARLEFIAPSPGELEILP